MICLKSTHQSIIPLIVNPSGLLVYLLQSLGDEISGFINSTIKNRIRDANEKAIMNTTSAMLLYPTRKNVTFMAKTSMDTRHNNEGNKLTDLGFSKPIRQVIGQRKEH